MGRGTNHNMYTKDRGTVSQQCKKNIMVQRLVPVTTLVTTALNDVLYYIVTAVCLALSYLT